MSSEKEIIGYTTYGNVRGLCEHLHKTEEAAELCVAKDHSGCKIHGGFSDRHVYVVADDGMLYRDPDGDVISHENSTWVRGQDGRPVSMDLKQKDKKTTSVVFRGLLPCEIDKGNLHVGYKVIKETINYRIVIDKKIYAHGEEKEGQNQAWTDEIWIKIPARTGIRQAKKIIREDAQRRGLL